MMEDKISGARETIVKSYVVPRLGVRVFPFKKILYADASFGWSFNLSGTETKTLGQPSYNASAGGFIYFLQVGARFKSPAVFHMSVTSASNSITNELQL